MRFSLGIIGAAVVFVLAYIGWQIWPQWQDYQTKKTAEETRKNTAPLLEQITDEVNALPAAEETAEELEQLSNVLDLLARGNDFLKVKLLTLAISDFKRATQLQPNNLAAWQALTAAQMQRHDFAAAQASVQTALKNLPKDPQLMLTLGQIALHQNDFVTAEQIFNQLPLPNEQNFYRGVMASFRQDINTALSHFNAVENDPRLGIAARSFLQAIHEWQQFPEGSAEHLKILIARSLADIELYELAAELCQQIVQTRPEYRDAYVLLGYSYLGRQRPDLARAPLQKARELDPTKPETNLYLGIVSNQLNQPEKAITFLTTARHNGFKPDSEISRLLGEVYLSKGDYQDARKEYEKIIGDGEQVSKYIEPIRISIDLLKDPTYAKILAQQVVNKHPDSLLAQNLLGWTQVANRELVAAERTLRKILQQDPTSVAAHLNMGKLRIAQNNFPAALTELQTAYELDPHSSLGQNAMRIYNRLIIRENNL